MCGGLWRFSVCYIDGWSDDAKMGLKMFEVGI